MVGLDTLTMSWILWLVESARGVPDDPTIDVGTSGSAASCSASLARSTSIHSWASFFGLGLASPVIANDVDKKTGLRLFGRDEYIATRGLVT